MTDKSIVITPKSRIWMWMGTTLVFCGLASLAYFNDSFREPSFEGKPLSEWLARYDIEPDSSEANEAVTSIGPKAIPILLRFLRSEEGINSRFQSVLSHLPFIKMKYIPPEWKHYRAAKAFQALAGTGSAAVPDLIGILKAARSSSTQSSVLWALGSIGPSASNVVSLLPPLSESPNSAVRGNACWAIGRIQTQEGVCLPLLLKSLHDSDPYVRREAVIALGNFGSKARQAIPELSEMLQDPSDGIRTAATNALSRLK